MSYIRCSKSIIMGNFITLSVSNAPAMQAFVTRPAGTGPFPAVIVFQEAFGVNHYIQDICQRISNEGYIAIAPEMYHRTAPPGFTADYTDFPSIAPHMQALSTESIIEDTQAAFDWLLTQHDVEKDKIGSIGFCMGGRMAFIANSGFELAASVSFYGGYMHTVADRAATLHGPQLLFWGGKDTHILPEHIKTVTDAIKKADKEYINVEISYADHGYFCNERSAYHAQAAKESWGMVKEFFKNKFGLNNE